MTALLEGHCLGPYRIVRLLGKGGMGAVYEARHEPLGRRVALKTLHAEFAENQDVVTRFFNEAKILSRLEHPSIVQVSDFGQADGTAYLVMEYLRGQSLARRLDQGDPPLKMVNVLQLAWQVADVLTVAHAEGVVHRDLKPDNLMLVEDPVAPSGERVKVLDFGIAKLTHAADRGEKKTDTLAVIGTPSYMSPEQCEGAGRVDAKTDVYSLGCVLYEALCGRPPFVAEGTGQLIGMHLYQTPTPLLSLAPQLPSEVADFVHRLLTKDKTQRPTMTDAADDLEGLLAKLSDGRPVKRLRPVGNSNSDSSKAAAPAVTSSMALGQAKDRVSQGGWSGRWLIAIWLVGLVLIGRVVVRAVWHSPAPPAAKPVQLQPATVATVATAATLPAAAATAPPVVPAPVRPAPSRQASPGASIPPLRDADIAGPAARPARAAGPTQMGKPVRRPAPPQRAVAPRPSPARVPVTPPSIPKFPPKNGGLPYEP